MPSRSLQWQDDQRILEILASLSYRTGELDAFLHRVAISISQLIGIDWVVITLCEAGVKQILASNRDVETKVDLLHGTVTGHVVATGHSVLVQDVTLDTRYGTTPVGYYAYLGIPLQTPIGKLIGTICCFHAQPRKFSPEDVRLTEVLAERAATAIDNYQLYEQQRQLNQSLEAEMAVRIAIEKTLQTSEERFRKIFDCSHDAIFVIDLDQDRILEVNPQASKLFGYSRSDLLSRVGISTVLHDQMPKLREFTQSVFDQGLGWTNELTCLTQAGQKLSVELSAAPIDFANRQCLIVQIRDVNNLKRAEQDRIQALSRLAEVGELAAMIVHEVRSPLTTVLMGLTAFQRLNLPEQFQLRLDLALEEADRLERLLNEILLFAKPQSLTCFMLEANRLIADLLESLRLTPVAAGKTIHFLPAPAEVKICGDIDKLKQVFINLITNACEAIPAGETITCQLDHQNSLNQIWIRVHNWGNPIPPEHLAKITQPFYTTKPSGNGLGLAIVKHIVEDHSGQLQIESDSSNGTTVTVQLPCRA